MTTWHFDVAPPRSKWATTVDIIGVIAACVTLFAVGFAVGQ
jgi:hypothetical protein